MRMKLVKEVLPIDNTGIFSSFKNPIWAEVLPNNTELDQYFNLRYGDRILNRKMEFFLNDEEKIAGTKLISLSDMIYSINKNRWKHLFDAYMVEYNPIENTDYIETFKENTDNTKVIDSETSSSGTASTESSGSNSASTSTDDEVFGFNSVASVGKDGSTGSNSNDTSASSETTTSSTGTEDNTIKDEGSKEYELRKHGNIGVTTNVTMLREDIDFWWKWSFVDYICQDICDFIALSIY